MIPTLTLGAGVLLLSYFVLTIAFISVLVFSEYKDPHNEMYVDAFVSGLLWPLLVATIAIGAYTRNQSLTASAKELFGLNRTRK